MLQKNIIEKQQTLILIQKNLRSFINVKAHCTMTHLKQQKNYLVSSSTPLRTQCRRRHSDFVT